MNNSADITSGEVFLFCNECDFRSFMCSLFQKTTFQIFILLQCSWCLVSCGGLYFFIVKIICCCLFFLLLLFYLFIYFFFFFILFFFFFVVVFIIISFGIIQPILVCLRIEYCLIKPVLVGV